MRTFWKNRVDERQGSIISANAFAFIYYLMVFPILFIMDFWENELPYAGLQIIFCLSVFIALNYVFIFFLPLKLVQNPIARIIIGQIVFLSAFFFLFLPLEDFMYIKTFSSVGIILLVLAWLFFFAALLFLQRLESKSLFVKNLITYSGKNVYAFLCYWLIMPIVLIIMDIFGLPFSLKYNFISLIWASYFFCVLPYFVYIFSAWQAFKASESGTEVPRVFQVDSLSLIMLSFFFSLIYFLNFVFLFLFLAYALVGWLIASLAFEMWQKRKMSSCKTR